MKTIVVGVDRTGAARNALRWAGSMSRATGSRVVVVHEEVPQQAELDPETADAEVAAAEGWLGEWTSEADIDALDEVELASGDDLADTIVGAAREHEADLLVLGTHLGDGTGQAGFGTIAHEAVHHFRGPTMGVPAGAPIGSNPTIVVGLDGHPGSTLALEWAARFANDVGGTIVGVHVPATIAGSYAGSINDLSTYESKGEVEAQLAEVAVPGTDVKVVGGDPIEELDHFASQHEVSLIVVGSRSHGVLQKQVIGKVPTHLLHHASRPVVVVPYFAKDEIDRS
jgi:nucleotide-binding universal stress UspA family protein